MELEKDFVCESPAVSVIGMNAAQMAQYIEFVADRPCALGYAKLYGARNPSDWMELISLQADELLEVRVAVHQKAGVMDSCQPTGASHASPSTPTSIRVAEVGEQEPWR